MINLANLTPAEFRRYVFFENEKYHPENVYTGHSEGILRRCIQLFHESGELPRLVPRDRLLEGLDFMSGGQGFFSGPADPAASWDAREGFYLAMVSLFRDLFSVDPMHPLAFMWFERMLVWSRDAEGRATLEDPGLRNAMLVTLRGVLALPSKCCREAALHGLNHIHYEEPRAAEQIIDGFLREHADIDDELRRYAKNCRTGRDR
jgi:hypothetical protein